MDDKNIKEAIVTLCTDADAETKEESQPSEWGVSCGHGVWLRPDYLLTTNTDRAAKFNVRKDAVRFLWGGLKLFNTHETQHWLAKPISNVR